MLRKNFNPTGDCLMGRREIFPQRIDGQKRSHLFLQQDRENFQLAYLLDLLKSYEILLDHPYQPFSLPPFPFDFGLA
jgi:hypothetical protein